MTNSKVLFRELITAISTGEQKDEIESVVYLFIEKVLGLSKSDIITERAVELDAAQKEKINDFIRRANRYEPIQYILGEGEFFGRTFQVNRHVLIPRPETEELVKEVIKHSNQKKKGLRILDIGTGSGCIPITLKLEIPNAEVFATDVSEEALSTARQNALLHKTEVNFFHHNILEKEIPVERIDIIVSNPPYIAEQEKEMMNKNVLDFEPHLALFVPDTDPLLYYKAIVGKSKKVLTQGGLIALEINERKGSDISNLFIKSGFGSVEVIKDIFGKERIVKGINA